MTFQDFEAAHKVSDLDNEPSSQHHSLGKGPNQAAPGNHAHETASPSDKPPSRPARGDVWVVTDMDNLRRRWDGISWNDEVLGDQALGAITADSVTAGAIDGQDITGVNVYSSYIEGSDIYGGTITGGVSITGPYISGGNVVADNIRTSETRYSQVEMGSTGGAALDEIRFWSNYYSCSVRNPSDAPGTLRFNLNNTSYLNFINTPDSWPGIRRAGTGPMLKFVGSVLQARTGSDSGYADIQASAFTVSSYSKVKENIKDVPRVDTAAALKNASLKEWTRKKPDRPVGPLTEQDQKVFDEPVRKELGLMAEDLPEFLRNEVGYDLNSVIGFLWEALKQSNERIAALEAKVE